MPTPTDPTETDVTSKTTSDVQAGARAESEENAISDGNQDVPKQHTSLVCLSLVARHHGIDVSSDRLIHDYSLENEEPTLRRFLRIIKDTGLKACLLYTSPSPRDGLLSRMPSSA